jgi:hypothetical protein
VNGISSTSDICSMVCIHRDGIDWVENWLLPCLIICVLAVFRVLQKGQLELPEVYQQLLQNRSF